MVARSFAQSLSGVLYNNVCMMLFLFSNDSVTSHFSFISYTVGGSSLTKNLLVPYWIVVKYEISLFINFEPVLVCY